MKKCSILIILIFLKSAILFAQAPQGLNYQAVAYNTSGVPVINQAISVRFSILDGSATGTLVYEETQNPTTDNTGLFSIVIGNGVVVSGTFASINWGNGSKWLKTEIDITGGTSYLTMGTSQFMSVPYALYANNTSPASGSFEIPDGFANTTAVVIPDSVNYTVPAGKNLYLPSAEFGVAINNDTLSTNLGGGGADAKSFVGASAGSVIYRLFFPIVGFLTDKTVDWITLDIANTNYTVPANKKLVIVNSCMYFRNNNSGNPQWVNCSPTINGAPTGYIILSHTVLESGVVISTSNCTTAMGAAFIINGYLLDN
ncbi:MAG: hypothetical protein QM737_06975 [Ferruginibacter sp.]